MLLIMNITFSVSVLYITFAVQFYLFEEVELKHFNTNHLIAFYFTGRIFIL